MADGHQLIAPHQTPVIDTRCDQERCRPNSIPVQDIYNATVYHVKTIVERQGHQGPRPPVLRRPKKIVKGDEIEVLHELADVTRELLQAVVAVVTTVIRNLWSDKMIINNIICVVESFAAECSQRTRVAERRHYPLQCSFLHDVH